MHSVTLALAFLLAVAPVLATAQPAPGTPLTLAETLRLAESASPAVRARQAELFAAEGARREARPILFNNPSLSLEGARRRSEAGGTRASEGNAGIFQPIEIGGQQARRREAAAATLDAVRAEIEDARRIARAEAALRFYAVLAAQRRVAIEQRSAELFESTSRAVATRRAAGEDTRLDANVALIEAERARNALSRARQNLLDARSALATLLQLPPAAVPEVAGDLPLAAAEAAPYQLDDLLAGVAALPRQRALAAREAAARARVGLERANRLPDLTVGLKVGREGASDSRERLTSLSISMPLPIFRRNDAALGQALTEATRVEIERLAASRDAQALVRRLWARLENQRERVVRLQSAVGPAAADNQQLAARSRQAGQIGLLDQLIVNRQALDAERDLIDALADFHTTRIELEISAGLAQEGNLR